MKITEASRRLIRKQRQEYLNACLPRVGATQEEKDLAGTKLVAISAVHADCVDALYGIGLVLENAIDKSSLQVNAQFEFEKYYSHRYSYSDMERYIKLFKDAKSGSFLRTSSGYAVIEAVRMQESITDTSLKTGAFADIMPHVKNYGSCLQAVKTVFDGQKDSGQVEQEFQTADAAQYIIDITPKYMKLALSEKNNVHKDKNINEGVSALDAVLNHASAIQADKDEEILIKMKWKAVADQVVDEVFGLVNISKVSDNYPMALYPLASKVNDYIIQDECPRSEAFRCSFARLEKLYKKASREVKVPVRESLTNRRKRPRDFVA